MSDSVRPHRPNEVNTNCPPSGAHSAVVSGDSLLRLTAKWPAGLPGHQEEANTGCYFCSQGTKFTITAQSVGREVGVPPSYLAIKCLLRGDIISQMGVKELGPGTGVLPGSLNERTSSGRCQEVCLVQGDAEAHRLSLP